MGVIVPNFASSTEDRTSGALVIDGGLKIDYGKTQYLTRTPGSAGNTLTWTWSGWIRKTKLATTQYLFRTPSVDEGFYISSSDYIDVYRYSGSFTYYGTTPGLYRDPSAWYHIVYAHDATAATGSRLKIYVNGVLQGPLTSLTDISSNTGYSLNTAVAHRIGEVDGHMSQVYFIDGQALDASYFGFTDPLTNTWKPKKFKPQATPNDGRTWNSTLSGTSQSVTDPGNAFNGDLSNSGYVTDGITFTPPSFMSAAGYVRSCRFYTYSFGQGGTIWLNGTQVATNYDFGSGGWYSFDMASVGYTLTSFKWDRQPGSGSNNTDYIAAIEINGVILLNGDTTNMGANAFYLPFDGNSPIGQDRSGRGNNWTPVNFGGSNTIEKATGALPILNTDGGGKVARVGVRTDSNASSLVLALPLVGISSDFSNAINSGTSNKAITANGNAAASSAQSNFYGGSFYFDGNGDWIATSETDIGNFGTGDFTVEYWCRNSSSQGTNFSPQVGNLADGSPAGTWRVGTFGSNGYLYFPIHNGSTFVDTSFNTVNYNDNVWHHFCVQRSSGTVSAYVDGVLIGTATITTNLNASKPIQIGREGYSPTYFTGYLQDVRIYKGLAKYTQNFIPASTDPDILPDTPSGVAYSSNVALVPSTDGAVAFDGSGDYLSISSPSADIIDWYSANYTLEYFVYANAFGSSLNGGSNVVGNAGVSVGDEYWSFGPKSGGTVTFYYWSGAQNSFSTTTALSTGRWYHLAFVKNSTSLKIYIDGVESASTTLSVSPQSSSSLPFLIGKVTNTSEFNGIISNLHITKGTALYTSNFTPPTAPLTSVANTKLLCCKSNSSATAFDVSPGTITANGNAAATNFNPFTANINTQRGQESGYATLDPLRYTGTMTFSNGNLNVSGTAVNASSNIAVRSGKWYAEFVYSAIGSTVGLVAVSNKVTADALAGATQTWQLGYTSTGKLENASSQSNTSTFAVGDTVSVAFDCSTGTATFYKNGISVGSVTNSAFANVDVVIGGGYGGANGSDAYAANFGQKPFKFPPPPGFQPLALANTPRPTIVRPDQYVGVTTYTGNSTDNRKITTGFKPDFVWIKSRSNSGAHALFDSIRGTAMLDSQATSAESAFGSPPIGGYLNTFERDGFTLKNGSTNNTYVNESAYTYVAWAWKAGGNSNTYNIDDVGYATASAAGLTAGTITPTGASVNTKSGFSIITYNGNLTTTGNSTVGHGLGLTPAFWISKSRSSTGDDSGAWVIWHKNLSSNTFLRFSTATPQSSDGTLTQPTSSVFTTTWNSGFNVSGNTYVAYIWAEIPGFSKFGSYTGNNSTDGVYVHLGFRPKFLIVKCTQDIAGDVEQWIIRDSTRSTYNPANANLYANLSNAEDDASGFSGSLDLLSNGFKMRGTYGGINASATYIYAAWAESPSFNLYGGQANAR